VGGLTRLKREHGEQGLLSEREDAFETGADQEAFAERTAKVGVLDAVAAEGAGFDLFKGVFVAPEAVGAADLLVDEAERGVPRGDAGAPTDGQGVEAEAVVDQGALAHLDRQRGKDVEVEEGRGEAFEVGGVGEEGEDGVNRAGENERGREDAVHGGRFGGEWGVDFG